MPNALELTQSSEDWMHTTSDGLQLELTTRYASDTFKRFYQAYDLAFVLPGEKEEPSGFQAALDLNHGESYRRLSPHFGPFREICLTVNDEGHFVGGANFFATAFADADGVPVVTSNLNYIFVAEGTRGKGYLKRIIAAIQALIPKLFSAASPLEPGPMFLEQNDPFRLTQEQYRRDTEFSGVDQFDRLSIWGRAGARIVDHAYIQPPLSDNQPADDTLVLSVIGAPGAAISPCILHKHLERFFAISVHKGIENPDEKSAQTQLQSLAARCAVKNPIALFDQSPMLTKAATFPDKFDFWANERPSSLLDALKRYETTNR